MIKDKTTFLDIEDIWRIFSAVYDEIAIPMSEKIPGYVACGVTIVDFRKLLWTKYHINQKQFAGMLQRIITHDRANRSYSRIRLYGGPIYLKHNWVECDGRHWLLIEVETTDHIKRMAPHREKNVTEELLK